MAKDINVATVGFDRHFAEAISGNGISVPLIFSAKNLRRSARCIEEINGQLIVEYKLLVYNDQRPALGLTHVSMPISEKKRLYEKYGKKFRANFVRWYYSSIRTVDGWMVMEHHFHDQIDIFYQLLRSKKIDLVIFKNFPHVGAEVLILAAAESLGLTVRMAHQSHMPQRFWISESIEDFGIFKTISNLDESFDHTITPPSPPFYMKQSRWRQSKVKKTLSLINQIIQIAVRVLLIFPLFTQNRLRERIMQFGLRLVRFNLSNPFRYVPQLKIDFHDLDGKKYIYFPLHLQPELTTEIFGGDYVDQILAIEELAENIDSSTLIVVKENPKQTTYMRGRTFYERLARIPHVRIVGNETSSFDLIKNSVGVATISGTAGWEALRMQRPVLLFGVSWYRKLPGVFEYDGKASVRKFFDFKFDATALEASYRQLVKKSVRGMVDPYYAAIIPDYDEKIMADITAKTFAEVIKSINRGKSPK